MPKHVAHHMTEARAIIHRLLAIIVAERLFVQISEQMKRFYRNIRAFQSALKQAPKVFESIGMHAAISIRNCVVNYLVLKSRVQADIRHERVRVDRASRLDMVSDLRLERPLAAIGNREDSDLAATFQNAECSGLVFESSRSNYAPSSRSVHETSCAADKAFISFDFLPIAAEHKTRFSLHGKTDSVQHEPRGFLCDAQSASYLVGTDPIFAVTNHPHRNHPLIHPECGILEDGFHFDGELFFASLAEPMAARRNERVLRSSATRTGNGAIRPAQKNRIFKRLLRVGEESNRFLQSLWELEVSVHA